MGLTRSLVANHEPTKGKLREVYISIRSKGQQLDPVDQILILVGGFQTEYTVAAAGAGAYVATLNGKTYTYTATGVDTVATIRDGLLALITKPADARASGLIAFASAAGKFKVNGSKTFTAAASAPASGLTVVAVASVAGSAAKGATTITLSSALTGDINPDQYLCFADSDGIERLARVTAKASVGATALTVAPLDQAIGGGAAAEFPPYLWDRTDASIDRSYSNSSVTTYNTGEDRDGVPSGAEKNITVPGLYYHYNAAYQTAYRAANTGSYIHVRVIDPVPNDDFRQGRATNSRALVTSAPSAAPQDGQVSADLNIAFMGAVVETDPIPV